MNFVDLMAGSGASSLPSQLEELGHILREILGRLDLIASRLSPSPEREAVHLSLFPWVANYVSESILIEKLILSADTAGTYAISVGNAELFWVQLAPGIPVEIDFGSRGLPVGRGQLVQIVPHVANANAYGLIIGIPQEVPHA